MRWLRGVWSSLKRWTAAVIVLTGATAVSALATGTSSLWIAVAPGLVLSVAGLIAQALVEDKGKGAAGPVWTADRPPYPGLEAFTDEDAAVFFGRSAETGELIERLHPLCARPGSRSSLSSALRAAASPHLSKVD